MGACSQIDINWAIKEAKPIFLYFSSGLEYGLHHANVATRECAAGRCSKVLFNFDICKKDPKKIAQKSLMPCTSRKKSVSLRPNRLMPIV